jgi:hypothetical protein
MTATNRESTNAAVGGNFLIAKHITIEGSMRVGILIIPAAVWLGKRVTLAKTLMILR